MKVTNYNNKKNFFKKFFIKLCRKIGYEIIDQNNLFIPTIQKFADQNLSKAGVSAINIPLGKTKITRKVEDLTIIVRSYTSTNIDKSRIMLDQNKDRVFNLPKIEYTLRTINSLIVSCHLALREFKNLKINLLITDDNSSEENLFRIKDILKSANFNYQLINIKLTQIVNK